MERLSFSKRPDAIPLQPPTQEIPTSLYPLRDVYMFA